MKKNKDFDFLNEKDVKTAKFVSLGIALVVLVILVLAVVWYQKGKDSPSNGKSVVGDVSDQSMDGEDDFNDLPDVTNPPTITVSPTASPIPTVTEIPNVSVTASNSQDPQDPQKGNMGSDSGAAVDVRKLLSSGDVKEHNKVTIGIDVSKYQGTIDWKKVASSGIDFVMVRVGYRTQKTGEIFEDTNAKYNMQEAQANGIKVGAYFFSTAINNKEAKEEADWVAKQISNYKITYPVAYDCEGYDLKDSRQYSLTKAERTDIAITFMQEIHKKGYNPMFYSSLSELQGSAKWDTHRIQNKYKIWVAQYPATPYPKTKKSSYGGVHDMWQYTSKGTIQGISRPVDVNVAYFGYDGTAQAKNNKTPDTVEADVEALMNFKDVNEKVTAKETTNLRNIPSQDKDSKVMKRLSNKEIATRTGISSSGWSRLIYKGKTYYAVSSFLTTDLNYSVPRQEVGSEDGLKTKFTDCNDVVTAKIEVNLRLLPSVTNPDAKVVASFKNGETVKRTGINEELGWSRVVYKGQTLYCVTSYLVVENN